MLVLLVLLVLLLLLLRLARRAVNAGMHGRRSSGVGFSGALVRVQGARDALRGDDYDDPYAAAIVGAEQRCAVQPSGLAFTCIWGWSLSGTATTSRS